MIGLLIFQRTCGEAVLQVRKTLTATANNAQCHSFLESYMGPTRVHADGRLTPRGPETATASDESEAVATSNIAGGGFEPPTRKSKVAKEAALTVFRSIFFAGLKKKLPE